MTLGKISEGLIAAYHYRVYIEPELEPISKIIVEGELRSNKK
jgi:hypothetical protein